MTDLFWVAGALLLLTGVVYAVRLVPTGGIPAGQKVIGSLWISSVLYGDALALFRLAGGPRAEQGYWLPIAIGLLVLTGSTVVLVARFHGGWARMLADTWLLGGVVTQAAWAITLAVVPGLDENSLLIELSQVAAALWVLALALWLLPGFEHLGPRALGTLFWFFGLRAGAMIAILVASGIDSPAVSWLAGGLLVAAHTSLAVARPTGLLGTLGLRTTAPVVPAQVPYIGAAVAGGLTVTLLIIFPNVRQISTYLLSGINVVALAVSQIYTAANHSRLVTALSTRERYFRHLVRDSTDVILISSTDGRVEYVSPAAVRTLGLDPDILAGRTLAEVLGVDPRRAADVIAEALGGPDRVSVQSSRTVGGAEVFLETVVSAHDGRMVCNIRDVTERVGLLEQLHDLAYFDPLTRLHNRAYLTDLVQRAVSSTEPAPSLLFIDLDGFKKVNDAGGHEGGDEVLREVGRRLAAEMPPSCEAGRIGGDEFVVLIPDQAQVDPEELAGRLISVIRRPYLTHRGNFVISASVGIAGGPGTEVDEAVDLLRDADLAAYEAKRNREGWRRFAPSMRKLAVARAELDAELADALADNRVFLLYQPVVELDGGRVVRAEALLRWRASDGTVQPPGSMLEFAERSGQGHGLSMLVLEHALLACAEWGNIGVAVNLTPAELLESGLVEDVRRALARHRLTPERLTLEITEGTLLAGPEAASAVITDLRSTGVRIDIDDFGNGYSSIAYLIDLPLDGLKIDRAVIQRIGRTDQASGVVSGILQLAATMSLAVVALGIETDQQEAHLIDLGCRQGQGFRFAPPLSAMEVREYVAGHGTGSDRDPLPG